MSSESPADQATGEKTVDEANVLPTARDILRERQAEYPPLTRSDRVAKIFAIVAPDLPAQFHAFVDTGRLAIGEVGRREPRMDVEEVNDGWVIEVSSAFMQFLYAVARELSAATTHQGSDEESKVPMTREELFRGIASIFHQWKAGILQAGLHLPYPSPAMGKGAIGVAEHLTTMGELFLVCHELGHVFVHTHPEDARQAMPAPEAGGEESFADSLGALLALRAASLRAMSLRMAYAGMLFATRVFAGLEVIGCTFPGYLPGRQRGAMVRAALMLLMDQDLGRFVHASTVAVAYDEMMESVELELQGRSWKDTAQTAERLGVRVYAMLEECAKGSLPREEFSEMGRRDFQSVPEDVQIHAAAMLTAPLADETISTHIPRMREIYTEWVRELPEPLVRVFVKTVIAAQGGTRD